MYSVTERKYRNIVRIPHEMEVVINDTGFNRIEKTLDVSKHGLFIRTKMKKGSGDHITISMPLSPPFPEIKATGVVVMRTVTKKNFMDNVKSEGLGVKFLEMSSRDFEVWDKYINKLLYEYYNFISPEQLNFQFKLKPQRKPTFLITFPVKSAMVNFFTSNVEKRNLFVYTENKHKIGDLVDLFFIHPETEGEFKIGGEVVDVDIENKLGINIKISKISKSDHERIMQFVENG